MNLPKKIILIPFFIFQTGPILFKCLMVKKEKVVLEALKIITRLIDDQDAYCRDNIQTLIQNCITLSKYPDSMVIIQC